MYKKKKYDCNHKLYFKLKLIHSKDDFKRSSVCWKKKKTIQFINYISFMNQHLDFLPKYYFKRPDELSYSWNIFI